MSAFLAFHTAAVSVLRPTYAALRCSQHKLFKPSVHAVLSRGVQTQPEKTSYERKRLRNIKIKEKHPLVRLVDRETDRLSEFRTVEEILNTIDLKTEFLELVSVDPAPLVRIFNKKESYEKLREAKARSKVSKEKNVQKEVQLTWGMAASDLAHKLDKVRDELEKGRKVNLVFTPKKGKPGPPHVEMHERLEDVVNQFAEIAREWKEKELTKSMAGIFLQGTGTPSEAPERPMILSKKQIRLNRMEEKKVKEKKDAEKQGNVSSDYTPALDFQD